MNSYRKSRMTMRLSFKPEFTIVIFIYYKPRIVVDEDDLKWVKNAALKNDSTSKRACLGRSSVGQQ